MRKRKVFSITMVKNEADIIESYVRYHLNIFDGMVILNNKSTDNTKWILENLKKEGLPIYVFDDTSFEYLQSEKMTKLLYSTIEKYNTDIVFPLDADEFLISTNKKNPREIIDKLELNKYYFINCYSYLANESDNQKELFVPKRIKHRVNYHHKEKVFVTKEIIQKYNPKLSMGNHNLTFQQKMEHKPNEQCNILKIAHFNIRSLEQAKSKFVIGWLSHLVRLNRVKGEGAHKERVFNKFFDNQDITISDFVGELAPFYEPINLEFCKNIDIKYTNANEVNFMKNLIGFTSTLAEEYVNIRKER